MSYRKLQVNGTTFEYSVGRSHVKIRHVGAYPKEQVGYVIDEREVRVRPSDIVTFIERYNLKQK